MTLAGETSPLPTAALSAGSADCHPREGGVLHSNPRPNRLPDTPSPRGSAPKTREMRRHKALLWTEQPILHIFM